MTMLHTIVLHFILLTSFVHLQESTAREADEAYRQGDYATAIEHYEAVLDKQCASAKLYYNLGNAYYRTDQMGLAILNYRRALRLDPSMTDARENLALAESRTVDRIDVLPQFFLVRWVDTLCTRITPTAWRIIWLVLLALTGAAVVLVRLVASRSLRKGAWQGTGGSGSAVADHLADASLHPSLQRPRRGRGHATCHHRQRVARSPES